MLKIRLKRIRKSAYDDLLDVVVKTYENTGSFDVDDAIIERNSEDVLISGKTVDVEFDMENLASIVDGTAKNYEKNAKIGMLLSRSLKNNTSQKIPYSTLVEKEVWTYLNLRVFQKEINKMYMGNPGEKHVDKIRRYYFNISSNSKVSRTGFKFLWMMTDKLDSSEDYETSRIAFEFIDPVKAMFERRFTLNSLILMAFVDGIKNNDCNQKFKADPFRSTIPKHISCFAAVNMLDAYDYDELVEVIAEEQKKMLLESE